MVVLPRWLFGRRRQRTRKVPRRVDRVAPWLLIGPALDAARYWELRGQGVTHVVDLRQETSDDERLMEQRGFRWLRVPVNDRSSPSWSQVERIVAWLSEDAGPETVLYLHCEGGIGRTPTVATALLMYGGLSLAEAQRAVSAARPELSLNEEQQAWLQSVAAERGRQPPP